MQPQSAKTTRYDFFQFWVFFGTSLSVSLSAHSYPAQSWAQINRYLEASAGVHSQDYREFDNSSLTASGVLDSESGNQQQLGMALRWQTENGWLIHLQADRQSGATDYNGYLQAANGGLTPYLARTGNVATQYSLGIGYAFNSSNWAVLPQDWQITPMLQLGQYHWQRNLVQYGEMYDHTAVVAGAMLQWQPRVGTVLEVLALAGQTRAASVSAPNLDFAAIQSGGSIREWQLGISQRLENLTGIEQLKGWSATARWITSRYDHGSSPVANSLQAPPNEHRPSSWTLGVQKQFF